MPKHDNLADRYKETLEPVTKKNSRTDKVLNSISKNAQNAKNAVTAGAKSASKIPGTIQKQMDNALGTVLNKAQGVSDNLYKKAENAKNAVTARAKSASKIPGTIQKQMDNALGTVLNKAQGVSDNLYKKAEDAKTAARLYQRAKNAAANPQSSVLLENARGFKKSSPKQQTTASIPDEDTKNAIIAHKKEKFDKTKPLPAIPGNENSAAKTQRLLNANNPIPNKAVTPKIDKTKVKPRPTGPIKKKFTAKVKDGVKRVTDNLPSIPRFGR